MIQYIIGIDFGHGETSANIIDLRDETKVKKLCINGNNIEALNSAMCYSYRNNEWIISPNDTKIKREIQQSIEINQIFDFRAYFKGPIIAGKKNGLKKIDDNSKETFGVFIKNVYSKILNNPANAGYDLIGDEGGNFLLFIACPSRWEQEQMDAFHEYIVKELGIPCYAVVKESNAAWIEFRPQTMEEMKAPNVLVVDYGSSTIDFTWVGENGTVHDGVQKGASEIEEALYEYIAPSKCAQNALSSAMCQFHDEEMLKVLIKYILRKKKEEFYDEVIEEPNDDYLELREIKIEEVISGASGSFVPDDENINKKTFNSIIAGYKTEVRAFMKEFRDRHKITPAKIILTGGASKMDFVPVMVKEVFGIATEAVDTNASYSISQGIAKYGLLIYKSEPKRIELENQLKRTWYDETWISNQLNSLVNEAVHTKFKEGILSIFHNWQDGNVKLDPDHTLGDYAHEILDDINKEKATVQERVGEIALSLQEYLTNQDTEKYTLTTIDYTKEKEILNAIEKSSKIWKLVVAGENIYKPNATSIHSLLLLVFDFLEENEKCEQPKSLSEAVNEMLLVYLKQEIEPLLIEYIKIFFKEENDETISRHAHIELNDFHYILNITQTTKKQLLRKMVEKAFNIIEKNDSIGPTDYTFNKIRRDDKGTKYYDERRGYFASFEDDFADFANSVKVEFEEDNHTGKKLSKQIKDKYSELYKFCVKTVK